MSRQNLKPPKQLDPSLDRGRFLQNVASKKLLLFNCLMALVYLFVITFGFQIGNKVLYILLIAGEFFHLFQILGYCFTVWDSKLTAAFDRTFNEPVDVFITVCGEPVSIVRKTAQAALAMSYSNFSVYILNDGYVANKDNWREVQALAKELNITCITRRIPGGAKAGNINHALSITKNPYVAVFDADHVPLKNFLKEVMGYFTNPGMGFVQTPQFYINQKLNGVTQTAWQQQTLFFGPIMSGKNRLNSAFMCGTNMVISRKALDSVDGMCEFNIAEDFLTSLFVHQKGWKSVYVPKVLAEGLAPEDFLSYYKQQYRWTRGSLEVIFKYNPLFRRGLSWKQKLQYLISASYYLSGLVVLVDALMPVIFLYTGLTPIHTSTMTLALIFIPYIFLNLYTLQKSSSFSYTFEAISFSLSALFLQIRAVIAVLTKQKTSFVVTSKQQIEGNFLYLVTPHLAYIGITIGGLAVAFGREGVSASFLANAAWVLVNIAVFIPYIKAALPTKLPNLSLQKLNFPNIRFRKIEEEKVQQA